MTDNLDRNWEEEMMDYCPKCGEVLDPETALYQYLCNRCDLDAWADEMMEGHKADEAILGGGGLLEERMKAVRATGVEVVGMVEILFQRPEGKSIWAAWVRNGSVLPHHIVWALSPERVTGGSRRWLGFLIDSGRGRPFFADLRTKEGRASLKAFEGTVGRYLSAKRAAKMGK